ncbi:hypothetical protein [Lentilactobacillus hilgardii]|uniref:hypothetical protein n=1 Tax=Lentilactobacillus hilgardii TaxID=1588 RepID=UPI0021A4A337|nr:hypothetical protein [Lentilactobacillus hilgardii]
MNKYVLSALVVPVALVGAVTAQAKTTLLKATVNQAKSGTKVVSGKATRGAKIKISRAGVTYGVAKANKHGHFVMKLKRAVKGGWTYKVTVTKAGFKVKSDHFKVKRTKKPAKVAVPSETTPTKPASVSKPSAPVASSTPSAKPVVSTAAPKTNANTNPRPNISAVDIEAYQINTEMASLNRQLDLAGFGQQRLATSLRTSLGNQIDQLQNRVNVFVTRPGVNSATISSMNSELNTLRQKFYGLPNTFVLSGSHTVTQLAAKQSHSVAQVSKQNTKAEKAKVAALTKSSTKKKPSTPTANPSQNVANSSRKDDLKTNGASTAIGVAKSVDPKQVEAAKTSNQDVKTGKATVATPTKSTAESKPSTPAVKQSHSVAQASKQNTKTGKATVAAPTKSSTKKKPSTPAVKQSQGVAKSGGKDDLKTNGVSTAEGVTHSVNQKQVKAEKTPKQDVKTEKTTAAVPRKPAAESKPSTPAANQSQNMAKSEFSISQQIADLTKQNDQLNSQVSDLDIQIGSMNKVLEERDANADADFRASCRRIMNGNESSQQDSMKLVRDANEVRIQEEETIQNVRNNSLDPLTRQRSKVREEINNNNAKIASLQKVLQATIKE